jgi:DNA topoisomerase III
MPPLTVLNVAEKPSVARALASVFAHMPGSQDRGMQRHQQQVFHHDNVQFPSVQAQGSGQEIQGPSEY